MTDLPIQSIKRFGWKPDKPDPRDRRMAVTAPQEMPSSAFYPPELLPKIRDQGNQGSCTGHATRSGAQFLRRVENQPDLELSPRFIYYNARVIEGTVKEDAGAEIRDVVKGVAKLGAASEKDCPYSDKVFARRPLNVAFQHAKRDIVTEYVRAPQTLPSLKACILNRTPVVFGFSVFGNFMTREVADSGLMPMPQGQMEGGHAVWIVGYDDNKDILGQRGGFAIGNSWSTGWGCALERTSRGYFWMPYSFIESSDNADDFWALRHIT